MHRAWPLNRSIVAMIYFFASIMAFTLRYIREGIYNWYDMKKNIKNISLLVFASMLWISCGDSKKKSDEEVGEKIEDALTVEAYEDVTENKEQSALDLIMTEVRFATLTKGLKSADLIDSLQTEKSITFFAPTNEAFSKLPEGKVSDLMKPIGKNDLISILNYHVVNGQYDLASLKTMITENNGTFELNTLQGNTIEVTQENDSIILTDELGEKAKIIQPDLQASDDFVHVIDMVLTPN